MVIVRNKNELEQAKLNQDGKIVVEGALARRLLTFTKLRKSAGIILLVFSLFFLPIKGAFTESGGAYSGPAPGFRYPLSSGSPPTLPEIILISIVFFIGILILWNPWSNYEVAGSSGQPLKMILIRKIKQTL